jgi:phosphatidylserine/phosphatidylglycerophosphate/cardiolipin synthase-like enzyme
MNAKGKGTKAIGIRRQAIETWLLTFNFFLFTSLGWAGMAVQTCFSPLGKCSSHIIREIAQAQREVLVAVYAFTSDELARALVKARQRGVKVRVVLDQEFDASNENSMASFLEHHGLPVRRISGLNRGGEKGAGLMHEKFAVIDQKVVLTGSYNWTASAESFNDENLLLFRDAGPLAEEYRKEFFRLWEKKR